jgi:hypothetical protein
MLICFFGGKKIGQCMFDLTVNFSNRAICRIDCALHKQNEKLLASWSTNIRYQQKHISIFWSSDSLLWTMRWNVLLDTSVRLDGAWSICKKYRLLPRINHLIFFILFRAYKNEYHQLVWAGVSQFWGLIAVSFRAEIGVWRHSRTVPYPELKY